MAISAKDISNARERMGDSILRTPTIYSPSLSKMTGADIHLKLENQQVTSSFKPRGAFTRIEAMDKKSAVKGVIAMSAGNHAQAVAFAAKKRGIPAYIVMPNNVTKVKLEAVKGYGANVILCEPTIESRNTTLSNVQEETKSHLVHPFNDPDVIAGQGTAALEMIEEIEYHLY